MTCTRDLRTCPSRPSKLEPRATCSARGSAPPTQPARAACTCAPNGLVSSAVPLVPPFAQAAVARSTTAAASAARRTWQRLPSIVVAHLYVCPVGALLLPLFWQQWERSGMLAGMLDVNFRVQCHA